MSTVWTPVVFAIINIIQAMLKMFMMMTMIARTFTGYYMTTSHTILYYEV